MATTNTTDDVPALRIGQADGYRWRGPRQSAPLLAMVEGVMSDCASLMRRLAWLKPPATRLTGVTPSVAPQVSPMASLDVLLPTSWDVTATQIQSLYARIDFLVRNPFL